MSIIGGSCCAASDAKMPRGFVPVVARPPPDQPFGEGAEIHRVDAFEGSPGPHDAMSVTTTPFPEGARHPRDVAQVRVAHRQRDLDRPGRPAPRARPPSPSSDSTGQSVDAATPAVARLGQRRTTPCSIRTSVRSISTFEGGEDDHRRSGSASPTGPRGADRITERGDWRRMPDRTAPTSRSASGSRRMSRSGDADRDQVAVPRPEDVQGPGSVACPGHEQVGHPSPVLREQVPMIRDAAVQGICRCTGSPGPPTTRAGYGRGGRPAEGR